MIKKEHRYGRNDQIHVYEYGIIEERGKGKDLDCEFR